MNIIESTPFNWPDPTVDWHQHYESGFMPDDFGETAEGRFDAISNKFGYCVLDVGADLIVKFCSSKKEARDFAYTFAALYIPGHELRFLQTVDDDNLVFIEK